MNNKEVARLWANQSRDSATGSHFYFEGPTIYSYGSHLPIARHYKGVVLFTTQGRSVPTSKHKDYVRSACSRLTLFEVDNVTADPSGKDVEEYGERIKRLALNAARARNPAAHLKTLESAVAEANAFCEWFKFSTRFEMLGNAKELPLEAEANAHLIASAPALEAQVAELRAALQGLLEGFNAEKDTAIAEMYGPCGASKEIARNQARAVLARTEKA